MAGNPKSMGLGQRLVQKQTQRLVITQDLRQSIELLPLSNIELSEKIQKELMENPLLEDVAEGESFEPIAEKVPPERTERERGAAESDWRENTQDSYEGVTRESASSAAERSERKHQFLQNAVMSSQTLADHLIEQLRLTDAEPIVVRAGEMIISAIDNRGFLTQDLDELFAETGIKKRTAEKALQIIHGLDPLGCGARTVAQTLLIQARSLAPADVVVHNLLEHSFGDLERLDYRKIERETGYAESEIERSMQFIRTLEPYPGTLFAPQAPEYVVPDIIIEEIDGREEIIINDDWIPGLRVNEEYRDMLRASGQAERQYLQEKMNSAQWLIKSIRQRRMTLYRVTQSILEFQRDFFDRGPGNLKPLTLRQVAEKVELHESTISRVTTNKYVQTRWGVFELKDFFSGGLSSSEEGGEKESARNIQERIRHLVSAEDPEKPLSDQDLVELIKKEGVTIARRTVAKYRKMLKILPGERRRKLKRLQPAKALES